VKRKTLTFLTASFILLASSFTFNSCKDCGKKKTEPAGRGGDTNNTDTSSDIPKPPEPKRELMLLQIQALVDKVAGYAYAAWFAAEEAYDKKDGDVVAFRKEKLQEVVAAREKLEELMKMPIVAEAKNFRDRDITYHVEAIELLSVKMEREEKWAAYLLRHAEWSVADAVYQAAEEESQEEAEAKATKQAKEPERDAAYEADDKAAEKWNKAWKAKSDAVKIARAAFVAAAKSKGKTDKDANEAFEF
jgi:hypothetical protein